MNKDFHLHSDFSADSQTPARSMIDKAISLGLDTMCFTDHQDFDYPYETPDFTFDTAKYFSYLNLLKEEYKNKINILIGIELGLQPHLQSEFETYLASYPFDFVIGSSHLVHRMDPYYPEFFNGRNEEDCYREYFESIIENIRAFSGFDVYGHLDYVVRYGPNKDKYYTYEKYRDIIDEILRLLIEKNLGIELNTAGFKYKLQSCNPHPDIIKRYKELGGEIITIGSDAHNPEHLAFDFYKTADILKDCDFKYYTIFSARKPEFIKL